jgi:hypothetical protein
MANPILSPKREVERVHRYRAAVVTLALQKAKRVIEFQLRAKGHKLAYYSSRELRLLAEQYFDQHRPELIADAEQAIATWPGFARWRCTNAQRAKINHFGCADIVNEIELGNEVPAFNGTSGKRERTGHR